MLGMIHNAQRQGEVSSRTNGSSSSSSSSSNNNKKIKSLLQDSPTDSEQRWQHVVDSLQAENEAQRQLIDKLQARAQFLERALSTSSSSLSLSLSNHERRVSRCESQGLDAALPHTMRRSIIEGAEGTSPIHIWTETMWNKNDRNIVIETNHSDKGEKQLLHFKKPCQGLIHDSAGSCPEVSRQELLHQRPSQTQNQTTHEQHPPTVSLNTPEDSILSSPSSTLPSHAGRKVLMVSSKLAFLPREVELGMDKEY